MGKQRLLTQTNPGATSSASDNVIWRAFEILVYLGSGEWLLRNRANGGTVIVARAGISALVLYFLAVGLRARLESNSTWVFSGMELANTIRDTLPWLGALFAGAYAGLYSRFASQWAYLADLYNQIMAAQIRTPRSNKNSEAYAKWFAGFIEDAESLHLALKPVYASVILSLLKKEGVAEMYAYATSGGEKRLIQLKTQIIAVLKREEREYP